MQQNGLYWTLFAPIIKSSIRNRYGKDLAERAIKNGKGTDAGRYGPRYGWVRS